jgi:hypothetical protein
MSLTDLASIGSLISGVAVLISLIYMNQQTRQNTKHTMALIEQGRTAAIAEWLNMLASDPVLMESYLRGSAGDQTMSDIDAARFVVLSTARFYSYEDQFHRHRDGLLGEAKYAGVVSAAKASLRFPGARASWTLMRGTFDTEFQDFMDKLMHEVPPEPAANFGTALKALSADELSRLNALKPASPV